MVNVAIHPSQFPQAVQSEMLRCLRERNINPKFHYLTYKQAARWLALHEAHSPARTDANCAAIYDAAFAATARLVLSERHGASIEVVGLGCGGGQKDSRLVHAFVQKTRSKTAISYIPCDVSLALVLTASEAVRAATPHVVSRPMICDLGQAEDLAAALESLNGVDPSPQKASRIVTFFGMIPNFEPNIILPRLASLLRGGDWLLLSANLAPGRNYAGGMRSILPGYDNELTRQWLLVFLTDVGVEPTDGAIRFGIEEGPRGLKRVVADFKFSRLREFSLCGEIFSFKPAEAIRLFYSYRYTTKRLSALLNGVGIMIVDRWIAASDEEGVFLCKRSK